MASSYKIIFTSVLFALVLVGCALDGSKYKNVKPELNLFEFFSGEVKAWGIVQDYSGELIQRFVVDMNGQIKDNALIIAEDFYYAVGDGVKQRTWIIEQLDKNNFVGSAPDIEGLATGKSFGNAFSFQYEMDIPIGEKTYRVKFNDWFWAFDDETIINRSYITKFGLTIAEVTIFMRKRKTL